VTVYVVLGNSFGIGYCFDYVLVIFCSTESWTVNKNIAKCLAACERDFLKKCLGELK